MALASKLIAPIIAHLELLRYRLKCLGERQVGRLQPTDIYLVPCVGATQQASE
eukprot:COSAG01_NODE_1442_length_10292_cov_6.389679_3_plen_53_part_00